MQSPSARKPPSEKTNQNMNHQSRSHDGCRVLNSKDSFEWWYFDLELRNRYHVHIEWHSPIFNFKDSFNTLIVRIHNFKSILGDKDGMKDAFQCVKAFRYHRSNVCQSEKICEIMFPSGYITEKDGNYFINILEKDLRIELKLSRLLPPLSIKDDMLYQTENGRKYLGWYIPLPKAVARGEIEVEGNLIEAEGLSYHDHNWGNLNLRKHLQGWVWARVFFNDFTLIFGDIVSNTPKEKAQVLLFVDREGHTLNAESLKIEYHEFDKQYQYNIMIPRAFSIEIDDRDSYRIVFRRNQEFVTAEVPFGSFDNNLLNLWLVRIYHLFQLHRASNQFRRWLGRFLYFQSEIICELYQNDYLVDRKIGNIEVISFAG